jgi:hypothetical protein
MVAPNLKHLAPLLKHAQKTPEYEAELQILLSRAPLHDWDIEFAFMLWEAGQADALFE